MSSILDDAREKIAQKLYDVWCSSRASSGGFGNPAWEDLFEATKEMWLKEADQILALSGTTDIECPVCKGKKKARQLVEYMTSRLCECYECSGTGSIPYKWKVSVTLENGGLPVWKMGYIDYPEKDGELDMEHPIFSSSSHKFNENQAKALHDAGYVQEVRQVVE